MPFKSSAQRRFMFAKHPKIAERWAHEYPHQGKLPKHASKSQENNRHKTAVVNRRLWSGKSAK
jgi:hypothetical protein